MYDLISPNMQTQFNLINKPNQSIKLLVDVTDKSTKKDLKNYTYNKIIIFKYSINIKNSEYILNIYLEQSSGNHFQKTVLGSFIFDLSIKYSISNLTINAKKIVLDALVYGFLQKDFIYSIYKKKFNINKI